MHLRFRRLWLSKFFLIPVGIFLLYTISGFILIPFVISWYGPIFIHDRFEHNLSIGKVRLNPFLMRFEVAEMKLTQADGNAIVGFDRFLIDFDPSDLFHKVASFSEFRIARPVISLTFEKDGKTNFAKFVPESSPSAEKSPSSSNSIGFLMKTFSIEAGEFTFTDKRLREPAILGLHDIHLDSNALSTVKDSIGQLSFSAVTHGGETIKMNGEIGLVPFISSGDFSCLNLKLTTPWAFIPEKLTLKPPSGKIDLTSGYAIDTRSAPLQTSLKNISVNLSGISLGLPDVQDPFFELGMLNIDAATFDLQKRSVGVGKILLSDGRIALRIEENGRSNIERIFEKTSSGPQDKKLSQGEKPKITEKESSNAPPWIVAIDGVEVKNIRLDLEDMSREDPLSIAVSNISINAKAKMGFGGASAEVKVQQLGLDLGGIDVVNQATKNSLFNTKRFFIEGGELDLGGKTLTLAGAGLSDGKINISRKSDGSISPITSFRPKQVSEEKNETIKESPARAPEWKYLIKNFEVSNFSSEVSDEKINRKRPLYALQKFRCRGTNIDGHSPIGIEMGFEVSQGGALELIGYVDPGGPSVDTKIKLSNFILSPLQPYLEPFTTLILRSAAVSTEGNFQYGKPKAKSKLSYDGSIRLDKLNMIEAGAKETFLGWEALQIPQFRLNLMPNRIGIDEIRIRKLIGQLIIAEDRTVNFSKVIKNPSPKDSGPKKETRPDAIKASKGKKEDGFVFDIKKIRLIDANVTFADFSLRPQFKTQIHSLNGMVRGLSSSADALMQIELDGQVDRYGMVRVGGAIDLNDFKRASTIDMVFQNVELTSITPYSGRFAGRTIKSGKLSMDLKYKIENSRMIGDNKIIVDNLELGEHVDSPDAVNLPLDLAVALLKDADGIIDIGLPVSGDLSDPQFSIGPLLWKAFVNLITKAVTAPFRALGALFGGGSSETFETVAFDVGKSELLPPEKEKIKKLSEVLEKRPQLKLVLQGRYSPESDGFEFKQTAVRRAVSLEAGEKLSPSEEPGPIDLSNADVRKVLEKMYKKRYSPSALDELDQGIKDGSIQARPIEVAKPAPAKGEKKSFWGKIMKKAKLYRLIPGARSPEQSEALALEIYARLVDSEPVSEEALAALAVKRAESVAVELQNVCGIASSRISLKDPEPQAGDAGLSVNFTLGAG